MADCLSNAVVLRTILQHFSNPELLHVSFVNKQWNYEARSVMKIRGNLIASLQFYDEQKEYLDNFAADLLRMNVIPFSGISIDIGHSRSSACQTAAPNSTYDTIFDRLQLKSLSVHLTTNWSKDRDCPGSLLITGILQKFSGVLKEVSLTKFESKEDDLIVHLMDDYSFPNLKILKLGENYERYDPTYITTVISELVQSLPNLQELHTQGPLTLMLNILAERSTVFVLQSNVSFDEIPHNAIDKIRLEKIKLHYSGPDFDLERFNRMTPMLLQAPCTATLQSINADAFLAVALMCYGICLEHVRSLFMDINPAHIEIIEPRVLRILKDFDFTRIFPNLQEVFICAPLDFLEVSSDHVNGFVEQANAILKEPEPDRAININYLDLTTSISSAAEFYTEMFPHIEKLQVREEGGNVSFGSIWKHWTNLKYLDVFADIQQHNEDLDSVICGIFPEEVAELREKDEEFLKKVNIVPVMPAITCLKNLRMFFLYLAPLSDDTFGFPSPGDVDSPPQLVLSKVAGLVAFARSPNLRVTLSTYDAHVYEALKHMKPYAHVQNTRPARAQAE